MKPAVIGPARGRLSMLVADTAYQTLRAQLVNWELPPGAPINIARCAEILRISHIPLREALHRLAAEGFLIRTPARGFDVPRLSPAIAIAGAERLCHHVAGSICLATDRLAAVTRPPASNRPIIVDHVATADEAIVGIEHVYVRIAQLCDNPAIERACRRRVDQTRFFRRIYVTRIADWRMAHAERVKLLHLVLDGRRDAALVCALRALSAFNNEAERLCTEAFVDIMRRASLAEGTRPRQVEVPDGADGTHPSQAGCRQHVRRPAPASSRASRPR